MKILKPNETVIDGKAQITFAQNDHYEVVGQGALFGQVMHTRLILAGRVYMPMDFFCLSMDIEGSYIFDIHGRAMLVHQKEARAHEYIQGQVNPEAKGFLPYINDATDSLLICPPVKGDPCLNALYFGGETTQDWHHHIDFRAGMVLSGYGEADFGDEQNPDMLPLTAGVVFYIPASEPHRFRTTHPMVITAYHPTSDFGPTPSDHPMINRTKLA